MDKEFLGLNKKKLKWLGTLLGVSIGLLLVVSGNPFNNNPSNPPSSGTGVSEERKSEESVEHNPQLNSADEEKYLAEKLQQMLELVEGAGKVNVTVRLESSSRADYAINTTTGTKTTQEKDQAGGTRVLTEDTDTSQLVLIKENSGAEVPVLNQEFAPEVAGVLVVAEGASNPETKAKIFRAVKVALGVEPQKIMVLAKEG
ncbi:MAG: hypothetical protein FH758_03660 [Firmicutes bacterium]|nr:hypothetical protein [Bacillota bacterium]